MTIDAEEWMHEALSPGRDIGQERRLAGWLLEQPQDIRYEKLDTLLEQRCEKALSIIKRSADHRSLEKLLQKHFPKADASTISLLLKLGLDVLGEERLCRLLVQLRNEHPTFWDHASYWLPSVLSKEMWKELQVTSFES